MTETEYTYEELKALCKDLFQKMNLIFGIDFVPTHSHREQIMRLGRIHTIASEAYNMQAAAEKKGLWN